MTIPVNKTKSLVCFSCIYPVSGVDPELITKLNSNSTLT